MGSEPIIEEVALLRSDAVPPRSLEVIARTTGARSWYSRRIVVAAVFSLGVCVWVVLVVPWSRIRAIGPGQAVHRSVFSDTVVLVSAERIADNRSVMVRRLFAVAPKAIQRHPMPDLPLLSEEEHNAVTDFLKRSLTRTNEEQRRENRQWEKGDCFIDVLIATEKLALLGATIESATRVCVGDERVGCAADVATIYATFAAAASYFSEVASDCPGVKANARALCAANIADINYGLGTLAAALAKIDSVCAPDVVKDAKPIAPGRARDSATAMCVINAGQAAAYVGHAVLTIRSAIFDCRQDDYDSAPACSADISTVLQSFFLIAAYLSNAAALCGETLIVAAECSNTITSVFAGLMEIAAGGSGAQDNCRGSGATHGNRGLDPDGAVRGAR